MKNATSTFCTKATVEGNTLTNCPMYFLVGGLMAFLLSTSLGVTDLSASTSWTGWVIQSSIVMTS